jgi:hypothetical protein
MSWGFAEGKIYNRRTDIHAKFGRQQQGGITTPSQPPLVLSSRARKALSTAMPIELAMMAYWNTLEKAKSVTWSFSEATSR